LDAPLIGSNGPDLRPVWTIGPGFSPVFAIRREKAGAYVQFVAQAQRRRAGAPSTFGSYRRRDDADNVLREPNIGV
jgi:hypothetical protein